MAEKEKSGKKRLITWVRITAGCALVLVLFYISVYFRIYVVPEDYTALHPHVLPGEHWVYKRPSSSGELEQGDIVLFLCEQKNGTFKMHVSLFIGNPGQKVEFIHEKRTFSVNGADIAYDLKLGGSWKETADTAILLMKDEYLFIANILCHEKRGQKDRYDAENTPGDGKAVGEKGTNFA